MLRQDKQHWDPAHTLKINKVKTGDRMYYIVNFQYAHLWEFVCNYCHVSPRRMWTAGSDLHLLTLFPLDPADPVQNNETCDFEQPSYICWRLFPEIEGPKFEF